MMRENDVTYYFDTPFMGTVRAGDNCASWEVTEVTFDYVRDSKPQPPDWLVFMCHQRLRDAEGEEVPVEVLSLLDLSGGLDEAFRREFGAAWDAVEIAD